MNSHSTPVPSDTLGKRLAILALAMLLPSLAASVANVALPTLAENFAAPLAAVQWVVVAYLLAVTVTIVAAGRLGDRLGRRRVLVAGLVVFASGAALSGASSGLVPLIAGRVVQGVGAAAMLALALSFVGDVVGKDRTGAAMGFLGAASAIGTALGPALGGVMITAFGWRGLFLTLVPAALVSAVLAGRWLPLGNSPPIRPRAVHALMRDPRLLTGLGASTLVAAVLMATLVIGPFYLSRVLDLPPALVGAVMSVGPLVAALSGVPAGRAVDRFGPGRATLVGLAGIAVGVAALAVLAGKMGVAGYVAAIGVLTSCYALFQAANNSSVMSCAGADQRGIVSGMLNLSRNLGLLGGALALGAVFSASVPDMAAATPAAIAAGMRDAFAAALGLVGLAMAVTAMAPR